MLPRRQRTMRAAEAQHRIRENVRGEHLGRLDDRAWFTLEGVDDRRPEREVGDRKASRFDRALGNLGHHALLKRDRHARHSGQHERVPRLAEPRLASPRDRGLGLFGQVVQPLRMRRTDDASRAGDPVRRRTAQRAEGRVDRRPRNPGDRVLDPPPAVHRLAGLGVDVVSDAFPEPEAQAGDQQFLGGESGEPLGPRLFGRPLADGCGAALEARDLLGRTGQPAQRGERAAPEQAVQRASRGRATKRQPWQQIALLLPHLLAAGDLAVLVVQRRLGAAQLLGQCAEVVTDARRLDPVEADRLIHAPRRFAGEQRRHAVDQLRDRRERVVGELGSQIDRRTRDRLVLLGIGRVDAGREFARRVIDVVLAVLAQQGLLLFAKRGFGDPEFQHPAERAGLHVSLRPHHRSDAVASLPDGRVVERRLEVLARLPCADRILLVVRDDGGRVDRGHRRAARAAWRAGSRSFGSPLFT